MAIAVAGNTGETAREGSFHNWQVGVAVVWPKTGNLREGQMPEREAGSLCVRRSVLAGVALGAVLLEPAMGQIEVAVRAVELLGFVEEAAELDQVEVVEQNCLFRHLPTSQLSI